MRDAEFAAIVRRRIWRTMIAGAVVGFALSRALALLLGIGR